MLQADFGGGAGKGQLAVGGMVLRWVEALFSACRTRQGTGRGRPRWAHPLRALLTSTLCFRGNERRPYSLREQSIRDAVASTLEAAGMGEPWHHCVLVM